MIPAGTATIVAVILLGLHSGVIRAETYVVHPDGSGDYPTIQAAIDAVPEGSVIELSAGTFVGPGNRDLRFHGKPLTVRSQSGDPEVCVIDCQGEPSDPHRGFVFDTGEDPGSVVQGLTIANGHATGADPPNLESCGGGILVGEQASPTILGLVIRDCTAEDGGAVALGSGSTPRFEQCSFRNNTAWWGAGGGAWCFYTASPKFIDCLFEGNWTNQAGGGLESYSPDSLVISGCWFRDNVVESGFGAGAEVFGGQAEVSRCSFTGNRFETGWGWGGGLRCENASVTLDASTLYGNHASDGAGLATGYQTTLTVTNTIVAFNDGAEAVYCQGSGSHALLSCCDLFGNEGGDWVGCVAGQNGIDGNLSADPFFCGAAEGDLTLDSASPCAPENSPECGLIGAWPVGCGSAVVEPTGGRPEILLSVRPNPAMSECRVDLRRPAGGPVALQLYNAAGRVVRDLAPGGAVGSAFSLRGLRWDLRDDAGQPVPSGVYFLRARGGDAAGVERLIVLR